MTHDPLTHPDDGMVYVCPGCEQAGQLRERQDRTVKCYDCGAVTERRRRLIERESRRGANLTDADRRRGGKNSPTDPERMREIAKLPKGETNG